MLFKGKYHKQVEGPAMGSQVSPIIANMYMEHFKEKSFRIAQNPLDYGEGM